MTKTTKTNWPLILYSIAVIVIISLIAATIYGLYSLADNQSRSAVNWWAVCATFALPLSSALGYIFGNRSAKNFVAGIETGIDKLASATQVRVSGYSAMRQAQRGQGTVIINSPGNQVPQVAWRQSDNEKLITMGE